jgi:hypothetical protein
MTPSPRSTGPRTPSRRARDEGAERSGGSPQGWLILIYRVPSEPTRLRAAVWRRLKNLGAVYLQSSVAAMPKNAQSERALRGLRNDIVETMGGTAFLVTTTSVAGEDELVAVFNAARDDEYEEILDKCRDFHAEVDKEVRVSHFTYAELEENEEDLAKLRGWFEKVRARDLLGAGRAAAVVTALAECADTLEDFANRVYEADHSGH